MIKEVAFSDMLIWLYAMLMRAEGKDQGGLFGRRIAHAVGLDPEFFVSEAEKVALIPKDELLDDTLRTIKTFEWNEQVLCVAWLCAIASPDGKIDEADWNLIYKIYHKELKLSLREILKTQNWLRKSLVMNEKL